MTIHPTIHIELGAMEELDVPMNPGEISPNIKPVSIANDRSPQRKYNSHARMHGSVCEPVSLQFPCSPLFSIQLVCSLGNSLDQCCADLARLHHMQIISV